MITLASYLRLFILLNAFIGTTLKYVVAFEGDSFLFHRNNKRTFKHFSFHTCLKLLIFVELRGIQLNNFRVGRAVPEISKQ